MGLASRQSKKIMDLLEARGPLLSHEIKRLAGFGKDGERGFDTAMTRLQMQTYITAMRFEYKKDKTGQTYGWGVGRYAMSEQVLGEDLVRSAYPVKPKESKEKLIGHLLEIIPAATREQAEQLN